MSIRIPRFSERVKKVMVLKKLSISLAIFSILMFGVAKELQKYIKFFVLKLEFNYFLVKQ